MANFHDSIIDAYTFDLHERYCFKNKYDFGKLDEDDVIELSSEMARGFYNDTLSGIVREYGEEKIKNHYFEKYGSLPKKKKQLTEFVTEILMESYFLNYYWLFGDGNEIREYYANKLYLK